MNVIQDHWTSLWRQCIKLCTQKNLDITRRNIEQYLSKNRWHSWDCTPWKHPWLTSKNLSDMRSFSEQIWEIARKEASKYDSSKLKYGFVGNIANNLYMRAAPLRKHGCNISIFLHPADTYIMSQPGWEEYNGSLEDDYQLDNKTHELLPHVEGIYQEEQQGHFHLLEFLNEIPSYVTLEFYLKYSNYLPYLLTLNKLQDMDALLSAQVPYLAYLSKRPYIASQMGGDIWYDCSRDDIYGQLQRKSFSSANAFLVSNPWSIAHARRYQMKNFIYLPFIIDEQKYSPGESKWRQEWIQQKGGNFFVLCTARLDNFYKGSNLALEAFMEFSKLNPNARLVVTAWGKDKKALIDSIFLKYNLQDKVILLPVSGKRRLIEYLRSADCLLDQFVLGYYGATALESMACGLPVIMKLKEDQYEAMCPYGAPPVHNSSTIQEICQKLLELSTNSQYLKSSSESHRNWFLRSHSAQKWGNLYQDFLCVTAKGYKFNYSSSPLKTSLQTDEKLYHKEQLQNAPVFPNYS
jgi:glycosyltransferase involved in cell wall biosynthesis